MIWFATTCAAAGSPAGIMDMRPHQSFGRRIVLTNDFTRAIQSIATDIVDYSRSALADGGATQLMGNNDLLNRMNSVQRIAQKVAGEGRSDLAGIASSGTALFTALVDATNGVARFAARSGISPADRQTLSRVEGWLRARSTELGAALLPLPDVAAIDVSTPERRTAMELLGLVRATRADESLVGSRPHISLSAGIDAVERAAQSFLLGSDQDRNNARVKLVALSTAILLTERVATNIGGRNSEPELTRSRSADLAGTLRASLTGLGVKVPSMEEQARNAGQWLWWEEVPRIEGSP